ncbi:MAG: hypothetical protein R6U85_11235 [Salinivirgaceae bacterium]
MATQLYGCIAEYGTPDKTKQTKIYEQTNQVINNLPTNDAWPPLNHRMFSIITNDEATPNDTNIAYNGRLIIFGANLKSVEFYWAQWKPKFERLLEQLWWTSANVHFKPEYTDLQTFKWQIDSTKWPANNSKNGILPSISPDFWIFNGDETWETHSKPY